MRRSLLTAPSLALAVVTTGVACSSGGGGSTSRSTAGAGSSGVTVQQSSSASGGSSAAVNQTTVGTAGGAVAGAPAGPEHRPADFGDLGRVIVRCGPDGRLAVGVELPPGAAGVDAQLQVGTERLERRVPGGGNAWSRPVAANDAFVRLRRGREEATATIGVAHARGGCLVTSVQSKHHRTG